MLGFLYPQDKTCAICLENNTFTGQLLPSAGWGRMKLRLPIIMLMMESCLTMRWSVLVVRCTMYGDELI